MKRSRLWFLYPVTGLFMIVFSLWMGAWYVGISVVLTIVMGMMLAENRFSKKRNRTVAPAIKLAHSLEHDEETKRFFEDGKAYYLAMERRNILDNVLGVLFLWASVLWTYERLLRPDGGGAAGTLAGFLIAFILFLTVNFLQRCYWQRALLHPLLRDNRPISASVACLLEGIYGLPTKRTRAVSIHNAAVGLYRGCRSEEALVLCRLARNMAGKYRSGLFMYLDSDTAAACHRSLGDETAAEREELRKEIILEENPLLLKNKDIQLNLINARYRHMIGESRLTDAEKTGEDYLRRCQDDYHRLQALGLMAEVKENLGKTEEVSDIRRKILTFSSENKEVRDAMAYGPCTYSLKKLAVHDWTATVFRFLYGAVIALLLFVTAAKISGADISKQAEITEPDFSEIIGSMEDVPEAIQPSENPIVSVPEESEEPYADNGFGINTAEFSVTYPEDWNGLYVEKRLENGGILVCQKKSYEQNGDGALFSITVFDDGAYVNEPDYEILGYDDPCVYVMKQPTDVTFYWDNEQIRREYIKMQEDLETVKNSFRILSDSAEYDGREYIFPNSSAATLQESDLLNLSAEELRIAKNEIYARHGRLFVDTELQSYFNGCSWYRGRIEPDEFDEGMLNELERANVQIIQSRQ